MNKATPDEAMKLALAALTESVDLVANELEDYKNLYSRYPSRAARMASMQEGLDTHRNAIAQLVALLADDATQPPQDERGQGLSAFDAAVSAELPCVSTAQFNSHEICKWFAANVRRRILEAGQDMSKESFEAMLMDDSDSPELLEKRKSDALETDAQRYRHLRGCRGMEHDPLFSVRDEDGNVLWGGDLDHEIDESIMYARDIYGDLPAAAPNVAEPAQPVALSTLTDGWMNVPAEPTDRMLAALFRGYTTREEAYAAMLSVAPQMAISPPPEIAILKEQLNACAATLQSYYEADDASRTTLTDSDLQRIWLACKSINNRDFCIEFGRALLAASAPAQQAAPSPPVAAEVVKDSDRINALEACAFPNRWTVARNQDSFTVYFGSGRHATRRTVREAIDAALSGTGSSAKDET